MTNKAKKACTVVVGIQGDTERGKGLINAGPRSTSETPKISNQESIEEPICF